MSVCKERTIQYLLTKYNTKQPGEIWTREHETESKRYQRMKQKINQANNIMNRLNMQGTQRKQVIYMLTTEFPNLKILSKNYKQECIIALLCFYVLKSYNSRAQIKNYRVLNELKLNDSIYANFITNLCINLQKKI